VIGMILGPVMSFLRLIPWWAYALVAVLAWGGWQRHRATAVANEFNLAKVEAAAEREKALAETLAETERRLSAQKEVVSNAKQATTKAKASASAASATAALVREQLAAIQADAGASNPAAASRGATGVLAGLLGECTDQYLAVAKSADEAIVAGNACQQSYESLTGK